MAKSKREYGTGSVFVRKGTDKLTIKYAGKQIATGLTDTPANRKKAYLILQKQHAIDSGIVEYEPDVSRSIENVYELFRYEKYQDLSARTKDSYELSYRKMFRDTKAMCTYQNIVMQCRAVRNKYSANTYNIYLRAINVFVEFCKKKKIFKTTDKLYSELRRKDTSKKDVVTLQKEDMDRLLEYWHNKDHEFYLLLKMLRFTGARISETLRLKWKDINFQTGTIEYPNKVHGQIQYFPITPQIAEILTELRSINNKSTNVFRWSHTTYSRLRLWLSASMQELGIELGKGNAFHVIRKTFATELFEKNVEIYDIKDLMRHSSIDTTLNHYKQFRTKKLSEILSQVQPEEVK